MSKSSSTILDDFTEVTGDLGGYESDFMYIASFISAFEVALKLNSWTFVSLRGGLEPFSKEPVMKDIVRRCFGLAGRPIISAADDPDSSRIDKAFARLLTDRTIEASILFPRGVPDISNGFNSLPVEIRTRLVRFLCQSTFETRSSSLNPVDEMLNPVVGVDADGLRYFLLKDTSLEVGCWREVSPSAVCELIATSTDTIRAVATQLRSNLSLPDRSKNMCVYCRKRVSAPSLNCTACDIGCCHYACLPAAELTNLRWNCSPSCHQLKLANLLQTFVDDIEPQQKAAMRKRRRLQGEISSLRIHDADVHVDSSSRRTSRGRSATGVDYSFRDYDRLMNEAIRKSERGAEVSASDEEIVRHNSRVLSREERMALREQKL